MFQTSPKGRGLLLPERMSSRGRRGAWTVRDPWTFFSRMLSPTASPPQQPESRPLDVSLPNHRVSDNIKY